MSIEELIKEKSIEKGSIEYAKTYIKLLLDLDITDEQAKEALLGEGNEISKIFSKLSSALQSLAVFSQVSKENEIEIEGIKYNEVHFEYRNKVIGKPSSLDVVLLNGESGFERDCLCLESKYSEYFSTTSPSFVIGPSYLSNNENGYFKKLKLTNEELINLGVDLNSNKIDEFRNKSNRAVSASLREYNKDLGNIDRDKVPYNYAAIKPINGNKYVYSEGIRQILSHIIGIMNIHQPDEKCCKYLMNEKFKTVRFTTIDNNSLNNSNETYKNITDDIHKHEEFLFNMINKKNYKCGDIPINCLNHLTYQKVYETNENYFKNMPNVVEYFKLDWKDNK